MHKHGGCKGACDRVPHQNVTELNLPRTMYRRRVLADEVLFHGLEDYIDHLKGDGVIVLHTTAATAQPITTVIHRSLKIYPNL